MSRRVPSTSSAVGSSSSSRSTIRHRSGAFSPRLSADRTHHHERSTSPNASEHSERTDHTITVQVEDIDDVADNQPTVLLIRRSRVSARTRGRFKPLPGLPFEGGHDAHSTQSLNLREGLSHLLHGSPSQRVDTTHQDEHDCGRTLNPVSLTPRPRQPERKESTYSVHSAISSRLPTPSYPSSYGASADLKRDMSSYFSRLPSFRTRPPVAPRIESDVSTYSRMSDDSTALSHSAPRSHPSNSCGGLMRVPTAIKDKRPLLVSMSTGCSTTDKFTQKFPRPRALRGMSFSDGPPSNMSVLLEEGAGLGIERVDRWTLHKWCLVLSVCTVFVYGTAGFVCAVLTWFRAWQFADVMYVADYDILVLLTLSSCILLLTALVGLCGALLNSRPLLAVYALLLWPALFSMLAIGYPAYKRYAFSLDRKLSGAWSEYYTPLGRRVIQDALGCCGFYTPLHLASPSSRCYPRTSLPGCKGVLWQVERENLATVWSTVFALVPVHIGNVIVALLCANHVTRTFGKGITPKRYRLSGEDVQADAEVLMKALNRVRPVARPGFTRAPTSKVFREDRTYYGQLGYDQ